MTLNEHLSKVELILYVHESSLRYFEPIGARAIPDAQIVYDYRLAETSKAEISGWSFNCQRVKDLHSPLRMVSRWCVLSVSWFAKQNILHNIKPPVVWTINTRRYGSTVSCWLYQSHSIHTCCWRNNDKKKNETKVFPFYLNSSLYWSLD